MSATEMHPGHGGGPTSAASAGSDAFVRYATKTVWMTGVGPFVDRAWLIPGSGIVILLAAILLVAASLVLLGNVPARVVALATFSTLALLKALDSALFAIWLRDKRVLTEPQPEFAFVSPSTDRPPGIPGIDRRASDVLAVALLAAGIWLVGTLWR